jgi:hypothetical protein
MGNDDQIADGRGDDETVDGGGEAGSDDGSGFGAEDEVVGVVKESLHGVVEGGDAGTEILGAALVFAQFIWKKRQPVAAAIARRRVSATVPRKLPSMIAGALAARMRSARSQMRS